MTKTESDLPAETGGTDITRFNALRHGVLSRYTVLPWEDADEYCKLTAALAAEHAPQGPTEEHLVEELAGILWRKRRLRLAEAAAHRHGLNGTLASYRETVTVALVHLDATDQSELVVDAIRATSSDTNNDIRDVNEDEAMRCSWSFSASRLIEAIFSPSRLHCQLPAHPSRRQPSRCKRLTSSDRHASTVPRPDPLGRPDPKPPIMRLRFFRNRLGIWAAA